MDPFSVAASIATIVALIGKSVSTLNSVRIQCQNAELRLELLSGQLETVQAALRQVNLLVTDCLLRENQHRQLVADLARAVGYCKLLVQHIDHQVSRLREPGCSLTLEKRVLLVLEDKAIEEYLTRLDHQLSALNVCINAFNCRSTRAQKKLLDKVESRTILEQAADDASSLVAVDESSSTLVGRPASVMSTQSKLSKVFAFDEVLLRHRIYQQSFRFMLRRASEPARNDQTPRSTSPTSMTALELRDSCERSARLDSMLKADAQKKNREIKILCLGHKRSSLVKQLRHHEGHPFQDGELHGYRRFITQSLVGVLLQIVDDVETKGAGFATDQARRYVNLLREFQESASPEWDVSAEVSIAARGLWRNWLVQQNFHHTYQDCTTSYFLESTDRILTPGYQPSFVDVIRAPEHLKTVRDTSLSIGHLKVDLIEVPHSRLGRLIHQFEGVDACLLSLDLASYDRYLEENEGRNSLEQGIRLLKGACVTFTSKPILLVCMNFSTFRRKLTTSPLSIHFPDFKGGSDPTAATNYILRRCKRMIAKDQDLYHHFAEDEAEDVSTVKFFKDQITILPMREYIIRAFGLHSSSTSRASDMYRGGFRRRLVSSPSV